MVTSDPDTQDAGRVRALSEDHALPVLAVHAPFLLMARRVWGREPVGKIDRAVELALGVGAPLVVVHPPVPMADGVPVLGGRTAVRRRGRAGRADRRREHVPVARPRPEHRSVPRSSVARGPRGLPGRHVGHQPPRGRGARPGRDAFEARRPARPRPPVEQRRQGMGLAPAAGPGRARSRHGSWRRSPTRGFDGALSRSRSICGAHLDDEQALRRILLPRALQPRALRRARSQALATRLIRVTGDRNRLVVVPLSVGGRAQSARLAASLRRCAGSRSSRSSSCSR